MKQKEANGTRCVICSAHIKIKRKGDRIFHCGQLVEHLELEEVTRVGATYKSANNSRYYLHNGLFFLIP